MQTVETAKLLDMDPKVALLSFSTKGSAHAPETEKVIEAFHLVKKKAPSLLFDGEMQFDAAYIPELAERKAPRSAIKGDANMLHFPQFGRGEHQLQNRRTIGQVSSRRAAPSRIEPPGEFAFARLL